MRLARWNFRGRPGFGTVVGRGFIEKGPAELRARLNRFATLRRAAVAQA